MRSGPFPSRLQRFRLSLSLVMAGPASNLLQCHRWFLSAYLITQARYLKAEREPIAAAVAKNTPSWLRR